MMQKNAVDKAALQPLREVRSMAEAYGAEWLWRDASQKHSSKEDKENQNTKAAQLTYVSIKLHHSRR